MGKKALYGALMGLGQGISQYGGALATQAAENKKFDRQVSLQEIRLLYDQGVLAENRLYQAGLLDDEYQREEDLITPGHPLYESCEVQRKKLADEKQANAVDLRKVPYGGSSGIMSNFNMSQWTPESARPFMAEVNRLIEEEKLSPEEAQRIASGTTPLVPKPTTTASDTANLNKSVRQEIALFMDQGDAAKVEILVGLGHPREVMETLTTLQLIEEFKRAIMGVMALPGQGGLMNAAPVSNGGPPDLASDPMGWLNSP